MRGRSDQTELADQQIEKQREGELTDAVDAQADTDDTSNVDAEQTEKPKTKSKTKKKKGGCKRIAERIKRLKDDPEQAEQVWLDRYMRRSGPNRRKTSKEDKALWRSVIDGLPSSW